MRLHSLFAALVVVSCDAGPVNAPAPVPVPEPAPAPEAPTSAAPARLPATPKIIDPRTLIRFSTADDARARHAALLAYLWPDGTRPIARPEITTNVDFPPDAATIDATAVARIDRLDAVVTGTNVRAQSYVLRPLQPASDGEHVVIIHQGHSGSFDVGGLGRAASFLLRRGFVVVAMHLPSYGWNAPVVSGWPTHEDLFASFANDGPGKFFRIFLEPIVQNVTYFEGARDVAMIGVSGGGWATTLAAAVDPRIRVAMEVGGSAPLYARKTVGDIGDREQFEPSLFAEDIAPDGTGGGLATWLELYVLAGHGAGRRAIQVNNELDPCCFAGGIADSYAAIVKERVSVVGDGSWTNVVDLGSTKHEISERVLESVLLPALEQP